MSMIVKLPDMSTSLGAEVPTGGRRRVRFGSTKPSAGRLDVTLEKILTWKVRLLRLRGVTAGLVPEVADAAVPGRETTCDAD